MIRFFIDDYEKIKYKGKYIFNLYDINILTDNVTSALNEFLEDKSVDIVFYRVLSFSIVEKFKKIIYTQFNDEQRDIIFDNTVVYIRHDINSLSTLKSKKYAFFRMSLDELFNIDCFHDTVSRIFGEFNNKITNEMYERLVINYDNFIEKKEN